MRALAYSYRHRRERKRDFHRLWIVRINAAARQNGVSYSQLMHGLKVANVALDRKVLAELAVHNSAEFARLVTLARDSVAAARACAGAAPRTGRGAGHQVPSSATAAAGPPVSVRKPRPGGGASWRGEERWTSRRDSRRYAPRRWPSS